ncbi:MAG: hypothetical protein PHS45_00705 [Bacilli bacterium]|nr:hypothetical protein [Bacilli bacterium]
MDRNEYLNIMEEINRLEEQKEKTRNDYENKLEKVQEELENELSNTLEDLRNKERAYRERLELWYKNISEKSTFDIETIGTAIATLLSISEESKYVYCKIVKKDTGYDDRTPWTEYVDAQVVIKSQYKECNTRENSFDDDFRNPKDCLVLNEGTPSDVINFNKFNKNSFPQPITPFYYGGFGLVKQFMNELIDHRIDNNMETINKKEIYDILKSFMINEMEQRYDADVKEIEQRSKESEIASQKRLGQARAQYENACEKVEELC